MKKIIYVVFGIFILVGVILTTVGIFVINNGIKENNRVYVDAIIERIDTSYDFDGDETYNVWVSYRIGHVEYNNKLNYYSPSYYEGKKIKIYYDKLNPNKIETDGSRKILWMIPGMGVLFLLIGVIPLVMMSCRNKTKKKLFETGMGVNAKYKEVVVNTRLSVNGVNPYNIICDWVNPNDGKTYIFKSDNIWFDPINVIEQNRIEYFKVYIDRNNIKKYVVDTSNIGEK